MIEYRLANPEDAGRLLEIYAPYVTDTAVSFEYEVPSLEEFENRIKNTLLKYPYIVAMEDGIIVGYAYASPFHARKAYEHCAELSIYIAGSKHGLGIGRALYRRMEELLVKQNVYIVYACIAATEDKEDTHLTDASLKFHEKMGFVTDGKHQRCGYKYGKWYDIHWMSKVISQRPDQPEVFIPFGGEM